MVKEKKKIASKKWRPSKMEIKEAAAVKRMAAEQARLAKLTKVQKTKQKKDVVKTKSAPAIKPDADIGELDIRLQAQFDNKTEECVHVTKSSFVVDWLEMDILIKALVTIIVPNLVRIGNKNWCKMELLTKFLSKIQKSVIIELGLMDQLKGKLPSELKDILDRM